MSMGKAAAERTRRAEKLDRLRAEEARRQRNRRLLLAGITVAVVLAVIAAFVVTKLATGSAGTSDKGTTAAAAGSSQVIRQVTSVPTATLDSVGVGSANNHPFSVSGAPPLTAGGRPEVLYVGAEYCPYCAATRWGIVVALSRFGTFNGLGQTTSSSSDAYADTPTLTFHGSSLNSSLITFRAYETQDRNGQPLDKLSGADATTFGTYDAPPYVPASAAHTIPFLDIGGADLLSGSAFDPAVLKGKTHKQIAASLSNPASPIAQAVDGEANSLTAAVCGVTNQQPTAVCSAPGVRAAAGTLSNSSQGSGSSGG
jgi:hypothetical protein